RGRPADLRGSDGAGSPREFAGASDWGTDRGDREMVRRQRLRPGYAGGGPGTSCREPSRVRLRHLRGEHAGDGATARPADPDVRRVPGRAAEDSVSRWRAGRV